MDNTKRCTKCKEVKPLVDFPVDKRGKHGRYAQCFSCKNARMRQYNAENKEAVHARNISLTSDQRSRKNARQRDLYHRGGKIKHRGRKRKHYQSNVDKFRVWGATRRTRIAGSGGHVTDKDIAHMRYIQQGHCCYCGRVEQMIHLEHIIPVKRGGSSDPWNLCLACRRCNLNKGSKLLEEWGNRWYLP